MWSLPLSSNNPLINCLFFQFLVKKNSSFFPFSRSNKFDSFITNCYAFAWQANKDEGDGNKPAIILKEIQPHFS